jgi:hypothetical protein
MNPEKGALGITLLIIGIVAGWLLVAVFGWLLGRAAAIGDRAELKPGGGAEGRAPARRPAERDPERRSISRLWSDAALARMGEEALRRALMVVKRALRTAESRLAELEGERVHRAAS